MNFFSLWGRPVNPFPHTSVFPHLLSYITFCSDPSVDFGSLPEGPRQNDGWPAVFRPSSRRICLRRPGGRTSPPRHLAPSTSESTLTRAPEPQVRTQCASRVKLTLSRHSLTVRKKEHTKKKETLDGREPSSDLNPGSPRVRPPPLAPLSVTHSLQVPPCDSSPSGFRSSSVRSTLFFPRNPKRSTRLNSTLLRVHDPNRLIRLPVKFRNAYSAFALETLLYLTRSSFESFFRSPSIKEFLVNYINTSFGFLTSTETFSTTQGRFTPKRENRETPN